MKKLLALVLVLAMLLSFAACGEDKSAKDDNDGDSKPKTSSVEDKGDDVSSKEEEPVAFGDGKTDAAPGKVKDNVYTNESLLITFTAPEGWTLYTEEQLAAINEEAENGAIADLLTMDNSTGDNISITLEDAAIAYGKDMSEDEYIEEGKKEFDGFESDTFKIVSCEKGTVKVAGQTLNCLNIEQDVAGTTVKQTAAVRKCGKMMVVITVTAVSKTTDDLLAMITKA